MPSLAVVRQLLQRYSKNLPRRLRQVWSQHGWQGLLARSVDAFRNQRPIDEFYAEWISRYDTLTERARHDLCREIAGWPARPLISLIMAVPNANAPRIEAAVGSVRAQLYHRWELIICHGPATPAKVCDTIASLAQNDRRICVHRREENVGRAGTHAAPVITGGDFIALMDCNDLIPEHALHRIAKELTAHPDADLIFSDEDSIDTDGTRSGPSFKSDWNPALMLSRNAVGRLAVLRRSLVEQAGGVRPDVDDEHDLVLRCARRTRPERIRHIPRVLYHRGEARHCVPYPSLPRKPRSELAEPVAPIDANSADSALGIAAHWHSGRRAIEEHLAACGTRATVARAGRDAYQIDYALPSPAPRISILIPSACEARLIEPCLESLIARTTYPDFEMLLLVNERHSARATELAARLGNERLRPLAYPDQPFNYSWVNNWGARQVTGELLCFLNDDTTVITPDWLERLAARAMLPGVAAVGAKLIYPNGTIQHAGVILGLGGVAGHAGHGLPRGSCGYLDRACLEQDVSCVTAACMVMRSSVFRDDLGGFDETLAVAFNDVDLCIRARAAGWRIIWTPTVELHHHESASAGRHDAPARAAEFAKEFALMRERWGPVLNSDPFYNPNLSLRRQFHLAFPPRA